MDKPEVTTAKLRRLHVEGETADSPRRRDWHAASTGPASRELLGRDRRVFLHQSLSTPGIGAIRRAEGSWIEDLDGRRFLDFHGNSVHHIGYGHPAVVAAVTEQMETLSFSPRRYTNAPAVALAERLAGRFDACRADAGHMVRAEDSARVLFTTGGSDAVEVALKIARATTGRFKTVSFWDSFHGAGFGAASVGGEATFRSHIAGPLLPGAEHVAPFACFRCPYGHPGPENCGLACAGMVRFVLEREEDVAAVIAEPVRAIPQVPPDGFWTEVRQACDDHGALLIFDEIPTGLGKTGTFFAFEQEGVTPDIVVLGKSLGGGLLPIAAVIARGGLDAAGDFAIGHYTHEKNPVTARAALAVLDVIETEGLTGRTADLGAGAIDRLRGFAEGCPIVGDVRGRGLLIGIDIVNGDGTRGAAPDRAERILYRCLEEGLSFKVSQGSVLTLSPPLTIARDELARALDIIEAAILRELKESATVEMARRKPPVDDLEPRPTKNSDSTGN
ncbi:MAG: aspartate aminotransferase family protein [Paracoccaceae bacterium]|nr:aspartate aminotransferase family protein [Paracoccaceae bacterium]